MTIGQNRWLPHLVLLLGVDRVHLPDLPAFIGSTHDAPTIARGEMPLTPGPAPGRELSAGADRRGTGARVRATPALT
jgi:sn-glycerol 3-phosphate transport system permease protein